MAKETSNREEEYRFSATIAAILTIAVLSGRTSNPPEHVIKTFRDMKLRLAQDGGP